MRSYIQAHLISSDYEGVVTLWDAGVGSPVTEYEAHEKRIWSVDFCAAVPQLFVSGSDDGWVKVKSLGPSSCIDRHCTGLKHLACAQMSWLSL